MIAPFLECEVGPGLRESEAQVTVLDITGRKQRLRVPRNFLRDEDGNTFLPIGIVARHPEEDKVLIEFPHEADSGANRIWVSPQQLLHNGTVDECEPTAADPLLGLMSDEPELVDAVLASAYEARETHPLRQPRDG